MPLTAGANDVYDELQGGSQRRSLDLYGGDVEDLEVEETNNYVYATLHSPNGLVVSDDGGVTWSMPSAGSDLGDAHQVEAVQGTSTALATVGTDLYRTKDVGVNWSLVNACDCDQWTMLYSDDDSLLLVPLRNGKIGLSTDLGNTLTQVTVSGVTDDRIIDIKYSASDDVYYALVGQWTDGVVLGTFELYKSTDDGATWATTSKSGFYTELGVDPDDGDTIVLLARGGVTNTAVTEDGGATWAEMATAMPSEDVLGDITFRSDGKMWVGPQYTEDLGDTWVEVGDAATSMDSFLKGNTHYFDDTNSRWWMECGRSMCYSDDDGVTWTDSYDGVLGVTVYDMSITDDKRTIWIAGQGGFIKGPNFKTRLALGLPIN